MSFYKVLGGRWGEGHKPGDIVEMDENAALVRVEKGDLELVTDKKVAKAEVTVEVAEDAEVKHECCGSKSRRHKKDCPKVAEATEEAE